MPPPPAEFYRANDGRIYRRPLPMPQRIRRLRGHAETLCNQALWYACSLVGLIGLVTAYFLLTAYSDPWLVFIAVGGTALVIGMIILVDTPDPAVRIGLRTALGVALPFAAVFSPARNCQ